MAELVEAEKGNALESSITVLGKDFRALDIAILLNLEPKIELLLNFVSDYHQPDTIGVAFSLAVKVQNFCLIKKLTEAIGKQEIDVKKWRGNFEAFFLLDKLGVIISLYNRTVASKSATQANLNDLLESLAYLVSKFRPEQIEVLQRFFDRDNFRFTKIILDILRQKAIEKCLCVDH